MFVTCHAMAVYGQPQAENIIPINDYLIKTLSTDEGLPMNQLNYLDASENGFIWIGTFEGLVRYDGVHFEKINHQQFPALKGGAFDVKIDGNGSVWSFDTNHRVLLRYDSDGEMRHWETKSYTKVVDYTLFKNWSDDVVFLGGNRFFQIKDGTIADYNISGLDGLDIHSALFADDSSLWVADTNNGLYCIKGGLRTRFEPIELGAHSNRIVELEQGIDHSVWAISSDNDLLHYSHNQWRVYTDPALRKSGPTRDLLAQSNGTVWIGTQNGLFRFNDGRIERLPDTPNQDADHVFCLLYTSDAADD